MQRPSLSRSDALLLLLAVAPFLPALTGDFVFDDTLLIQDNAFVHHPAYWRRALQAPFWDVSSATPGADAIAYYRPLVTLSYLANWLLGAGQTWEFHLANVLIHLTNTCLVLVLSRRWVKSPALAWACTLLFAVHPSRAEAVSWISGRPDPLMTFFVLLALVATQLGERRSRRAVASVGVAVSFSAAVLCKEPALALPVLLAAGALAAPGPQRRWHLGMAALSGALGAAYLLARHLLLPINSPPLSWTPAHALVTLTHYFSRVVFPWPLTFFYRPQEFGPTGPIHSWFDLTAGAFLLLVGIALSVHAWRRDRAAFAALLAAATFLGPLLNLCHTSSNFTAADRFLYLPLWLLALGLGRLFEAPLERLLAPLRTRLLALGVIAVHASLIAVRSLDFDSSFTLWNAEIAVNSDNPIALRGRAIQWTARDAAAPALADLKHSLRSESLRFAKIASHDSNLEAYGHLIALAALQVPDGRWTDLQTLASDALDRLAGRPRASRSSVLDIDWPTSEVVARKAAVEGEKVLAGHIIPLMTRLDARPISTTLLDAIPDERLHLTPNPLLIAIAEAREERFDRARSRIRTMRERQVLMPKVVTDAAIADVEARLQSAEAYLAADAPGAGDDRHFARMKAFATLSAYGRALLEARQVQQPPPDFLPIYAQILVFARLDGAAFEAAARSLGPERARSTVAAMVERLPPELRRLAPVDAEGPAPR